MDPLEEVIKDALASGTALTLAGAVALGKAVVPKLWSHLSPKGQKQLELNLRNFSSHLKSELKRRIEAGQISEEQLHAVKDDPAVIDMLLRTLENAALTSDADKQHLLAKLLAERLGMEAESDLAVVSRMACDTIPNLSARNLKLLALCSIFATQRYHETSASESSDEAARRLREVEWLIRTFEPYQDVVATARDAEHLVAVGCIGALQGFLADELKSILERMVSPDLDKDMFMKTATWHHLETVWNDARLAGFNLTSVGSLIGMYTSDILANRQTDIDMWLNRS